MNDETQETTVLEDHQIKLLLEDIEKAYVPRQDINFLSLCNQQQRVYGLPGSSVSKLKRNETKPNQTKPNQTISPVLPLYTVCIQYTHTMLAFS